MKAYYKTNLTLLLASIITMSCTKTYETQCFEPQIESSQLTITLDNMDTKAQTAPTGSEKTINDLQVFVFDSDGNMDINYSFTTQEIAAKKASFSVKTGTKTVYVVANLSASYLAAAQNTCTLDALKAVAVDMAANIQNSSCVPIMVGSKANVALSTSGAEVAVQLDRLISRITLNSVTNSLPSPYGAIVLKRAFLCNVPGNQNLAGNATAQTWLNMEATINHNSANDVITSAANADVPLLTYKDFGNNINPGSNVSFGTAAAATKIFYSYPNSLTNDNRGFHSTFVPTATALMVVAEVRGVEYYYPISLKNGLVANTEYSVSLTISGLGNKSNDPFAKIEKGSLSAVLELKDWTTGEPISENI